MDQDNKAIVRRFVEEFQGAGRPEVGEELLAADFRNRSHVPGVRDDRIGVLRFFGLLRELLPDLRVEIHHMLTEGDMVATHKTFHATCPGFRGATGPRTMAIEVMDFVRMRDGLIVEHWNSIDRLSVIRRLGPGGIVRLVANQAPAALHRLWPKAR